MIHTKEWPFTIISEYTTHPEHLAKAFINHATDLWSFLDLSNKEYPIGLPLQSSVYFLQETLDDKNHDECDLNDFLDEIMEVFTTFAPDGYYFSANPDDGACFGYWKVDYE